MDISVVRLIHGLSHSLGRGSAVGHVELDAEILGRAAGIVAGRHDDAAVGLVQPDQMAGGRELTSTAPCPTITRAAPFAAAIRKITCAACGR